MQQKVKEDNAKAIFDEDLNAVEIFLNSKSEVQSQLPIWLRCGATTLVFKAHELATKSFKQ